MRIVLASSNKHKVQEINEITQEIQGNFNIEFVLPPEEFNPIENGLTFEENSYIKAFSAWKLAKTWVLADDSGLCIDALDGRPGIHSARYDKTPELRIAKVLNEMSDIEPQKRTAHFTCAMTLINPVGETEFTYSGICNGSIINAPRGKNGFGYDPIFIPNGYNKTIAELSEQEKNQISHRSIALREILKYINCHKF